MSGFRKTLKKWLPLPLKIGGAIAAAGPAINVIVTDVQGNKIGEIGPDMLFAYTGIGSAGIDFQQTARGLGAVVGGIVLIKLGSILGKAI